VAGCQKFSAYSSTGVGGGGVKLGGGGAKLVFLEVIFFGVFFGQVWGNLGKNPSHPQKFACSYTYGL